MVFLATMTDSHSSPVTEARHERAEGLDLCSDLELVEALHQAQISAVESIAPARPALARGGRAMADAVRAGRKIVYAAAGSSGLMGLADGLEIHPTFGIPIAQIRILRAGGLDDIQIPKGQVEDSVEEARNDAQCIEAGDCVICLAASGNTPYAVEILRIAKARGAVTIGISNNAGTRLIEEADIPVLLPTPPELIAGSTRLGAGTAQKIALNTMSSLMGVRLGHVMDGLMVNVVANNVKLFHRAENIVIDLTGCNRDVARAALDQAGGQVKLAILLVAGAPDLGAAETYLHDEDHNLRAALARVEAG